MAAAEVSSSSNRKRTHLSLEKKVEIISKSKTNPGIGVRVLADIFSCSKTQIAAILKQKESILSSYESNASTSKKSRASKFLDINEALYEWYTLVCSKNIYPDGSQLLEKARKIAECLGKHEFVGTNGWLETTLPCQKGCNMWGIWQCVRCNGFFLERKASRDHLGI